MKTSFLLVLFLISLIRSYGAMSLLKREMFENNTNLDTNTPGAFSRIVQGTAFSRRVGPYLINNYPGWSADMHAMSFDAFFDLTVGDMTLATNWGAILMWMRVGDYGWNATMPGKGTRVFRLESSSGTPALTAGIQSAGNWTYNEGGGTSINGSTRLMLHTWYLIKLEWHWTPTDFAYQLAFKTNGGIWFLDRTNLFSVKGRPVQRVHLSSLSDAVAYMMSGRYGGVCLEWISDFGEGRVPADILPPIEERHTWYVNTLTGNDGNDGSSPDQAWQSGGKLSQELYWAGVLGTAIPWVYAANSNDIGFIDGATFCTGVTNGTIVPNGDIVHIDTSGGPLILSNSLVLKSNVAGIEICGDRANVADLRGFRTLAHFVHYDATNWPNVWETSDTQSNIVLWEDRKWMNAPTGATILDVRTNLNSTPGSFWTDGTTLYLRPFNANPNSNGALYERSQIPRIAVPNLLGSTGSGALIDCSGLSVYLHDIKVGGSTSWNPLNNTMQVVYPIRMAASGRSVISSCYPYYGSTHDIGGVGGSDPDLVRLYWNVICGGQRPTMATTTSGYTGFVEYTSESSNGNRYALYLNCVSPVSVGVIGSSVGTVSDQTVAGMCWLTHASGTTNPYSRIDLKGCDFASGNVCINDKTAAALNFSDCKLRRLTLNASIPNLDRCSIGIGGIYVPTNNAGINIRNSAIAFGMYPTGDPNTRLGGSCTIVNCTLDARSVPDATRINGALIPSSGGLALSFSNNIVMMKTSLKAPVVFGLFSSNSIEANHNVYWLDMSSGKVAKKMDGAAEVYDLAAWQGAGHDSDSVNSEPGLNRYLQPISTSLARRVHADSGWSQDYTGKWFTARRTAGCIEYRSSIGILLKP